MRRAHSAFLELRYLDVPQDHAVPDPGAGRGDRPQRGTRVTDKPEIEKHIAAVPAAVAHSSPRS
jgi:hypothetical protein